MSKKYDDLSLEELVMKRSRQVQSMEPIGKFWFSTWTRKAAPEIGTLSVTMRKASGPFAKGCFVST